VTTIHVLGSGSRGNCLAVSCDGATLLVDAGFSARETERRAVAAGVALDTVVGIAVTHEHTDHCAGVPLLARRLGVPVLTTAGTWTAIAAGCHERTAHRRLDLATEVELGPFRVHATPSMHDAVEPVVLAVHCADGERVGVAYDLGRSTTGIRFLLRDLSALVLESNHDEMRLRTCGYPPSVQERIASSTGHLSNRAAAALLGEICHEGLGLVVLAHLSEKSNDPDEALRAVLPALQRARFGGALHVAGQHLPLPALPVNSPAPQLALRLA
jgi:phosphoribosyl 1,2-cyclic phosphodiesterase